MIGKILKIGLENKKGAVCVPLFLYVVFLLHKLFKKYGGLKVYPEKKLKYIEEGDKKRCKD